MRLPTKRVATPMPLSFRFSDRNRNPWFDDLPLKIANIVGAIFFIGGNVYKAISPWDVYYTSRETYFTPAPWSFFIWPLIHMLILGVCIYQFFGRGKEVIIDLIGWWLPLLDFFTAMYIYTWTVQKYRYALVFILFAVSVATEIYRKLKKMASDHGIFVHLPFSLYHGWTVGLVFLSAFEAFGVDALTELAGPWTKAFVFISFLLLLFAGFFHAFSTVEGDLPGCFAVSWYFFAVVVHQSKERSRFIHWSGLGFAIFSLCWIMKCVISLTSKFRGGHSWLDDEGRAPLLGSRTPPPSRRLHKSLKLGFARKFVQRHSKGTTKDKKEPPNTLPHDQDAIPYGSPLRAVNTPRGVSKEWIFSLPLTLDEMYHGTTYRFLVTRELLSHRTEQVEISIDIPPGARGGTRIVCPRTGHQRKDGTLQDVVFLIEEVPGERFSRVKDDLFLDVCIPLVDLLADRESKICIQGIDGKEITFTLSYPICDNATEGQVLVKGAGMPIREGRKTVGRGDMIVRWRIVFATQQSKWQTLKKALHLNV